MNGRGQGYLVLWPFHLALVWSIEDSFFNTDYFIEDEPPEMDIFINNVVCSFSVRCHLNLKEIALTGSNVEYR